MSKKTKRNLSIFAFLAPAIILFVGVLITPIIVSFIFSFFKMKQFTLSTATFVVLGNYKALFDPEEEGVSLLKAFFTRDKAYGMGFITALRNSLILAFFSVFLQLPLSLGLALVLGRRIKGEKAFLSIYFMPVLISTIIIGQLFSSIYNPDRGMLNAFLKLIGHEDWIRIWLIDKNTRIPALFLPTLWQYVGYHMLLMYAGVKGVSPDLREAAMLDGATNSQVNRYIVIPSIKPIIKVSVIFAVTGSLKSYDLVKMLAGDRYDHYLDVPSILMIREMNSNNYGMASAIATMLIFLCFFFALLIGFMFREKDN